MNEVTEAIRELLAKPFPPEEIKSYNAAGRTVTYIDARAVMNRLDEVVGPACWWDSYRVLDDGAKAVECSLTVVFNSEDVPNPEHLFAVTKIDIGYPNDARDAGDDAKEPLKAAYSDALKRAAVKFGIGRHLYEKASTPQRQQPARATPPGSPDAIMPFDVHELDRLLADANMTRADLVAITGPGGNGGPRPQTWLNDHPGSTLADLVKAAKEAKQVPA